MLRTRIARAVAGALAVGLLTACGSGASDGAAVPTLAKVDGWRSGFDTTSIPGQAGDDAVLELAYDDAAALALWEAAVPDGLPAASGNPSGAGIYGDLADVDLTTHVLGLWSSGQSGSCPGWLGSVDTDDDAVAVVEAQGNQGDECTSDYNAYSQVVVLDRDQVPPADALPVHAGLTFATVDGGALHASGRSGQRALITEFVG